MSHQHRGFTKDTSSAAQSRRAKAAVSPWRKGPMCDTGRAKASFINYCRRGKSKPVPAV